MEVTALELPGAYLLKPKRYPDMRGFFVEPYNKKALAAHGLTFDFVQDNLSMSERTGTIRGLHYQAPPSAQTKLIWVSRGALLDVLVDIRHGSPTYGRHVAIDLSAENGAQGLVPRGVAHGFCTLADHTMAHYKVDAYYDQPSENGLLWNDPALGIRWPVDDNSAVIIDKDKKFPLLRDLPRHFEWKAS
jgi:dTDP-4-dehydrorhamnose 3,5-epimerase